MNLLRPVVIGTLALLIGCAGVNPHMVNEEFEANLHIREGAYRLKPEDILSMQMVDNVEYSQDQVAVTMDGYIDTPLGRWFVSGKTLPEVQSLIRREQREFPTSPPPIILSLVTQAPEFVWVGGEVGKAGPVRMIPSMSAMEAVMEAGGNLPSGKMREILLIRRTANWKRVVRRVDLKILEEDLVLMPRDIVFVPRTVVADIQTFVDQYITRVIPFNYWSFYSALAMGM